jgi:hypothetical protein
MGTLTFLDEDKGPTIIATASLMIFLSTLFVALRYYARLLTSTSLAVQDLIVPFAWLAEVGLCINGISKIDIYLQSRKPANNIQ